MSLPNDPNMRKKIAAAIKESVTFMKEEIGRAHV